MHIFYKAIKAAFKSMESTITILTANPNIDNWKPSTNPLVTIARIYINALITKSTIALKKHGALTPNITQSDIYIKKLIMLI